MHHSSADDRHGHRSGTLTKSVAGRGPAVRRRANQEVAPSSRSTTLRSRMVGTARPAQAETPPPKALQRCADARPMNCERNRRLRALSGSLAWAGGLDAIWSPVVRGAGDRIVLRGLRRSSCATHRQTMSPSSMALPISAPAPAPMIAPSVFDPPGAMMCPSTPPPMPPMINPVVPSSRRQ